MRKNCLVSAVCLICFTVVAVFTTTTVKADVTPQVSDNSLLEQSAASAYYRLTPGALIGQGNTETFLFLSNDPAREHQIFSAQTSRLIVANRNKSGHFTIICQYDLPTGAMGAVWWGDGKKASAALVTLYSGEYLTLSFNGISFVPLHRSYIDTSHIGINLNPGQVFFSESKENHPAFVFFAQYALSVLNIADGQVQDIFAQPNREETSGKFLAAQDLDDDGTLDIVGDTSRFVAGASPVAYPSTLRVWHYDSGKFQEIWQGQPRQRVTIESYVLSEGRGKQPVIVAHEAKYPKQSHQDFLYLYRWNGKNLVEIASSEKIASPINYQGVALADLTGDGTKKIIAQVLPQTRGVRLAVFSFVANKLTKQWESPPLAAFPIFGRVSDYRGDGKQEVPLLVGDNIFFFRQSGQKFVGWESLKLPPLPVSSPASNLDTRLDAIQYQANLPGGPFQTFLVLDEKKLKEVYSVPTRSAFDRANDVRDCLIVLAKQKLPAAQVVSRKIGDEDEEPKMEVAAGKTVIITLTQSEAKAQGKTLAAYAQEWVSTVQTILKALAVPKR